MKQFGEKAAALALLALLIRLLCGLHSYSGQGTPPKYGDFEAQRHWMEIAVGTPARLWYTNTTDNDLAYWGLDYPPLSGYQSWLYGKVIEYVDPEAVVLHESRGHETPSSKALMRWTAVLSDLLFFLPACWAAASVFGYGEQEKLLLLAALLLNPAQLLMDHGHFQYNGISLGLAAGAAVAICTGRHVLGSIMYCLSLNHKQMSLYYAPAFFTYLLASCLRRPTLAAKVAGVARLGIAVVLTFALVWLPYLGSLNDLLSVVRRVFPTKRGLFEDYVANFWCVSSLLIKWKRLLSQQQIIRACTLLTLAGFLPSIYLQIRDPRPQRLLVSMALSGLSFYQFSFQVHEKSILLPLLPLSMLPGRRWSLVAAWTAVVAVFSMGPLLVKDGLVAASMAVVAVYVCVVHALATRQWQPLQDGPSSSATAEAPPPLVPQPLMRCATVVSISGMVVLTIAPMVLAPPARWPFLWDALVMAWSYAHFAALFLYLYSCKWC